jgi:hypothetical protein
MVQARPLRPEPWRKARNARAESAKRTDYARSHRDTENGAKRICTCAKSAHVRIRNAVNQTLFYSRPARRAQDPA